MSTRIAKKGEYELKTGDDGGLYLMANERVIYSYPGGLGAWAEAHARSHSEYPDAQAVLEAIYDGELDGYMSELLDWCLDQARREMLEVVDEFNFVDVDDNDIEQTKQKDAELLLEAGISPMLAEQYVEAGAFFPEVIVDLVNADVSPIDAGELYPGYNSPIARLLSQSDISIEDVILYFYGQRFDAPSDAWEHLVGQQTPQEFMRLSEGMSVREAVNDYLRHCPFDLKNVDVPRAREQLIEYIQGSLED